MNLMSTHKVKTGTAELSPRQIFEQYLPVCLQGVPDNAKLKGSVGLFLLGENGGAWTVDFKKRHIFMGLKKKVDLYLRLSEQNFLNILYKNAGDPNDPNLEVKGDVSLIQTLSRVADPSFFERGIKKHETN